MMELRRTKNKRTLGASILLVASLILLASSGYIMPVLAAKLMPSSALQPTIPFPTDTQTATVTPTVTGTSTPTSTVATVAPLRITKTLVEPESGIAIVGDTLVYQITIQNVGQTLVTRVWAVDEYPVTCMRYVSSTPSGVDDGNGPLTWDDLTVPLGDIPPGDSILVTAHFQAVAACPAATNRFVTSGTDQNGATVPSSSDEESVVINPSPSTSTVTPTPTATSTPTLTPEATVTATETASATPSATGIVTETPTATATEVETATGTPTATEMATDTPTITTTPSPTATETPPPPIIYYVPLVWKEFSLPMP